MIYSNPFYVCKARKLDNLIDFHPLSSACFILSLKFDSLQYQSRKNSTRLEEDFLLSEVNSICDSDFSKKIVFRHTLFLSAKIKYYLI